MTLKIGVPVSLLYYTITDMRSLLQNLEETRSRQYAVDAEENEYGVFCVGAVVMDHTNRPIGAISISGSSLTEEEEKRISGILISRVNQLSSMLGYAAERNLLFK